MHARKINDRLTLSVAFFLGLSVFTNGIYQYNLPAYQFHNSAKQLDNQGPILSFFFFFFFWGGGGGIGIVTQADDSTRLPSAE